MARRSRPSGRRPMSASVRTVPRGPSRSDRVLPIVYGAITLLAGLLILPSTLRPLQDQPQTSSAFSADAPSDPNQQSVFSSFRSAGSGTSAGVDEPVTTTTV